MHSAHLEQLPLPLSLRLAGSRNTAAGADQHVCTATAAISSADGKAHQRRLCRDALARLGLGSMLIRRLQSKVRGRCALAGAGTHWLLPAIWTLHENYLMRYMSRITSRSMQYASASDARRWQRSCGTMPSASVLGASRAVSPVRSLCGRRDDHAARHLQFCTHYAR